MTISKNKDLSKIKLSKYGNQIGVKKKKDQKNKEIGKIKGVKKAKRQ